MSQHDVGSTRRTRNVVLMPRPTQSTPVLPKAELQTDRYCRVFCPDAGKSKNLRIMIFQKNNGQGDWESLIRPGLSKIWLWDAIFEVCTVMVSMCSSQLSLIKLPPGNLLKLETTLKACWSTDCWSASDRKYFRSMFWPVAIVFVTMVNMCEQRLWSGGAERTKKSFQWPLIRK